MSTEAILDGLLKWWAGNMILAIVLITIALLAIMIIIGRSLFGYMRSQSNLANMKEHAKKLGAIPLADGKAFVSIKAYRIYFKELFEAGLMTAAEVAGAGESTLVRTVAIKPEELGAVNNGLVTCQYDEHCTEKGVYEWKIRGFIYIPQHLLHDEE